MNNSGEIRMNNSDTNPFGTIEVDLFPQDIDDFGHPDVQGFKELLEEVAEDYGCMLIEFSIHKGTVCFAFDDDVLTADILRELEMEYGD
jgi:hypothetical protein